MVKCEFCGNTEWDVHSWENKAYCTNCNTARDWYPRNRRVNQMTPSQKRAVRSIQRFFERNYRIHEFETTLQDKTGLVYVSVHTSGHVLTEDGGHFVVGRRGKVKCLSVYTISKYADETLEHYNHMLRNGR